MSEHPLAFAGEMSTFAGKVPLKKKGEMELQVLAMDPPNANFGLVVQKITVSP